MNDLGFERVARCTCNTFYLAAEEDAEFEETLFGAQEVAGFREK